MKRLILILILCLIPVFAQAQVKLTDETAIGSVTSDDIFDCVDDPGGTPLNRKCTATQIQTFVLTGEAATATALAANGSNCSAGNYPLGVDASGAAETCTSDDDIPESGDFGNAADLEATGAVSADSINLSELDDGSDTPLAGECLLVATGATDIEYATCPGGGGGGDSVSIDGVGVVDPDFVSAGDIDFVDTSNTVTGNIKTGVVDTTAIADDGVNLVDLDDGADTPVAGECLLVAAGGTDIEYATCPGGGGSSQWTDTGTILHPNEDGSDEIAIGGTTEALADIFLGVDGAFVFNEQGNAADGRMEGDTEPNLFFLDASADMIGIGTATPQDTLDVSGTFNLTHTATQNDDHGLEIQVNAAGFGDVKGIDMVYTTGAIGEGEDEEGILINIDQSLSTGGRVVALEVLSTTTGSAEVDALEAGVGVHPILQESGVFGNVAFCEVFASAAFTDCVTAANSTGTDTQFWVSDNDIVYIGAANQFEEIEWIWDTVSGNPGLNPVFEFSITGSAWTAFSPADGTNGARNNGVMAWTASDLIGWIAQSVDGDSAFWIRITRTSNSITGPTEDLVQSAAPVNYHWDKDGSLVIKDVSLEGSTDDAFETLITNVDPTADRTITLPDDSGTVKLTGKETAWFPASSLRPTVTDGAAAVIDVETTSDRPDMTVVDFDGASTEKVQLNVGFLKSWDGGTVTWQAFWTSTATDTDGVTWGFKGVCMADGDSIDVAYGSLVDVDDANQSTAEDVYVTAETSAMTFGGVPGDDELCFVQIFRDVDDTNDTATEDARLLGVKLFYTTDLANDN